MFNLQSLVAMASQAMLKKLISSDSMYSQWNTFCKKWGLPQTSRAEFDNLVSQFNSTPADQKMAQLQNANPEAFQKFLARMKNKDGSSGAYWTLEDVEKVAASMGIDWGCKNYNIYDLYYTLNMVRSDYYKDGQAPQYYADLAFDFLEDKDAPEGKAKRYYLAMHCAE